MQFKFVEWVFVKLVLQVIDVINIIWLKHQFFKVQSSYNVDADFADHSHSIITDVLAKFFHEILVFNLIQIV